MDFNEYWQENKRFVLTVLGALILFWIGNAVISGSVGADLKSSTRKVTSLTGKLKEQRFTGADKSRAMEQNEALEQTV